MGVTAMMVGGTFGIVAKAATNNLMKISLRRGVNQSLHYGMLTLCVSAPWASCQLSNAMGTYN